MFSFFKKLTPSNQTWVQIIYVLLLGWLSFFAWVVAWPFKWAYAPIFLVLAYTAYRFIFEVTLNRGNVPTIATCFLARQKITEIVKREAALSNKETFTIVDMGSGRGELTRRIAKHIPNATVTGIEMARAPYLQSSFMQHVFGPKNLSYKRSDFWLFDCSHVDAIVLYLGPLTAERMGNKLHQELATGSMVISHTYPLLGEWTPIDVLEFRAPFKEIFYVYKKKVN